MRVRLFLSGIHARSEELIDCTRSFEKRRLSKDQLSEAFERDTKKLINLQTKMGFDLISDGMLSWSDPVGPIIECLDGITMGPYSRWFETNTFYRRPIMLDKPTVRNKMVDSLFYHANGEDYNQLFILPGPYTLSKLSEKNKSDLEHTMLIYSDALAEVAKRLRINSHSALVLLEPGLVYEYMRPKECLYSGIFEALNPICSKAKQSIVHTFFGDAYKVRKLLANLGSTLIGVDFSETSFKILSYLKEPNLAFGILDSLNPIVETPELLTGYMRKIIESKPEEVAVCPNTDLRFLPRELADRKILALGAIKDFMESN